MASDFNRRLIDEFRATNGAVEGPGGTHLLLLTTRGARTGEERLTPLAYSTDGDRYVVVGSKGGAPTHPAWYHNLMANPEVTVEVGAEKFPARTSRVEGEERERLLGEHIRRMPFFADYLTKTSRVLPVIIIERAG